MKVPYREKKPSGFLIGQKNGTSILSPVTDGSKESDRVIRGKNPGTEKRQEGDFLNLKGYG